MIRNSKSGPFLGCASYPKCDFIRPLAHHDSNEIKILEDSECPECSKPLVVKNGRYGMFIGCTGYPECHYIASEHDDTPSEEPVVGCPKCKKGHLVSRSNKFGKVFYSCDCYPSCKYTLNHKPVAQACPAAVTIDRSQYETILDEETFNAWLDKLQTAELFAFDTETDNLDY